MANTDNYKILKTGISWSAFERFAVQGMQFVVFVFMARGLSPTDYGLVGMLAFFIVISQLIAEGGLSQAIIRKLDRDEADLSTSFYVNIAGGAILYLLLFAIAPLVSGFYGEPRLTGLLRVMALCIPIQSSLVVHRAVLTSRLDFKTQAKSTFVGTLTSGFAGIYMAYNGYGAWSIVCLQLTNQVFTAITLWLVTQWRPKLLFSTYAFRRLYGFGSKLLMSKVVDCLYNSFYVLAIGKVFSAYALGCYTNARQLGSMASENLTRIVNRAAFPMFCGYQNDPRKLCEMVSEYIRLSMFFIAPLMLGIAALAVPLTTALIGHQWLYTARLLRILCLYFLFFPLNSINFMILEIYGKGGLYLKLQIANVAVGLSLLAVTIPFGLSAVCVGLLGGTALNFAINAHLSGRHIGLGLLRQCRLILPTLIIAALMATAAFSVQLVAAGEWIQVGLGTAICLLTYGCLSMIFQTRVCVSVFNLLKSRHPLCNAQS
jgi:O-antigen/teichoic acid export membrane protein